MVGTTQRYGSERTRAFFSFEIVAAAGLDDDDGLARFSLARFSFSFSLSHSPFAHALLDACALLQAWENGSRASSFARSRQKEEDQNEVFFFFSLALPHEPSERRRNLSLSLCSFFSRSSLKDVHAPGMGRLVSLHRGQKL